MATTDAVASSEFEVSSSGTIRYFGDYELLEEIARGGMGVVYRARQLSLNRLVALKMIAAGRLATPQAVERFRTETEAVALLDHPNIIPIYQVGAEAGMHYYAMKLVEGGSLAEGMKKEEGRMKKQDLGRRASSVFLHSSFSLLHFIKVARAIHYAHQRGILHRDLKPGNILLDHAGEPYVTDFGLAKFVVPPSGGTEQPAKAGTTNPLTQSLAIIGTPSYMAPEQAAGQSKRLTTTADIYSLGAILYELLAGRPPFTGENELEILRRVVEGEPLPPSLICRSRREEAHSAKFAIRNSQSAIDRDLETICLKCLHKEPQSRYGSAEALAQDLERWRAGETIQARPSTGVEKTWRWCRRKPALASVSGTALLLCLALSIGGPIAAIRIDRARQQAEQATKDARNERDNAARARDAEREARLREEQQRKAAEAARAQAQESESDTKAFTDFLVGDVLAVARPEGMNGGLGINITVAKALEAAEQKLGERFSGRPKAEAIARGAIGGTWQNLSRYEAAEKQLRKSLELNERHLGFGHWETITSRNNLGVLLEHRGRGIEAAALHATNLDLCRRTFGSNDVGTLKVLENLASSHLKAGRLAEAIPIFEEVLKSLEAKLGAGNPDILNPMNDLARAYQEAGKLNKALPIFKDALTLCTNNLDPNHHKTLMAMNNLAGAYGEAGQRGEALALFEESMKRHQVKFGPDHSYTLNAMRNVARAYSGARRFDEAISLSQQIVSLQAAKLGPDDDDLLWSKHDLAKAFLEAKQFDEAESLLRALTERVRKQGPNTRGFADILVTLGDCLLRRGNRKAAEPPLRESLAIWEKRDPNNARIAIVRSLLGESLTAQQRYSEAEPLLLRGYEGLKRREAERPAPWRTGPLKEAGERIVQLYEAWNKADEAAAWRDKLR